MTDNIVALDFNGVKIKLETDDSTVLIKLIATGNTGTAVTFHDQRDQTNYQVPTNKKAKIIFIEAANMSAANDDIFFADNADGTTNKVTLIEALVDVVNEIFISATIPADKFINMIDAASNVFTIFIVEETA